jgi:type VI secretion system secreted protein Hcp
MVNKKALLIVASALVTALILSSLAVTRTARSEGQTQANPDLVMFLQIDGIPGESSEALHMNWIEIDAFNWSEAMASVAGGRASGRLSMTDFQFGMTTNKASPMLFLACATGRRISNATLDVCTPGGNEGQGPVVFLRFNFTGVTITSYSIAGNTPEDRPVDEFSITFTKITMTYWQFGNEGGLVAVFSVYYDLAAGRGGINPT